MNPNDMGWKANLDAAIRLESMGWDLVMPVEDVDDVDVHRIGDDIPELPIDPPTLEDLHAEAVAIMAQSRELRGLALELHDLAEAAKEDRRLASLQVDECREIAKYARHQRARAALSALRAIEAGHALEERILAYPATPPDEYRAVAVVMSLIAAVLLVALALALFPQIVGILGACVPFPGFVFAFYRNRAVIVPKSGRLTGSAAVDSEGRFYAGRLARRLFRRTPGLEAHVRERLNAEPAGCDQTPIPT